MGIALAALAVGGYAVARGTSVFAVRRLEVVGGSPRAQAEVRAALASELGRSLLAVSGDEIDGRVASVADVRSVRFDRAFPHTLRIVIRPERAVLLLRRGRDSWVVSTRGRVLRPVKHPGLSSLPRVWVPRDTAVAVGSLLPPTDGRLAAAALAAVRPPLAGRIGLVRADDRELTFVLRSGLEIRFGDRQDLRLKLAIAPRILATVAAAATSG